MKYLNKQGEGKIDWCNLTDKIKNRLVYNSKAWILISMRILQDFLMGRGVH